MVNSYTPPTDAVALPPSTWTFFTDSAAFNVRVDEKKSEKARACSGVIAAYTRRSSVMSRDSIAFAYVSMTTAISAVAFAAGLTTGGAGACGAPAALPGGVAVPANGRTSGGGTDGRGFAIGGAVFVAVAVAGVVCVEGAVTGGVTVAIDSFAVVLPAVVARRSTGGWGIPAPSIVVGDPAGA